LIQAPGVVDSAKVPVTTPVGRVPDGLRTIPFDSRAPAAFRIVSTKALPNASEHEGDGGLSIF
jgi:hypothetical protein